MNVVRFLYPIDKKNNSHVGEDWHHGFNSWLQPSESPKPPKTLSPSQLIKNQSGYMDSSDQLALQSKLWLDVQPPNLFEAAGPHMEPSPLIEMSDGSIYIARPLASSKKYLCGYIAQQI